MMNKNTAFNITIDTGEETIDLRIPKLVDQSRLKKIIGEVLEEKGIRLPNDWELSFAKKQVLTKEDIRFGKYPISDGEQFTIETENNLT